MAIKKSELYSSLWKSCDELRGGMDASQYKDYVLVLLFVKYISDRYAGKRDALLEVRGFTVSGLHIDIYQSRQNVLLRSTSSANVHQM